MGTNKRILIVENDSDTLYILTRRLVEAGYEVETCSSGTSLVEGRKSWPDVFVFDRDLPGIDGIALCKYLKLNKATKDIPIIMISAYPEAKTKAVKAGVSKFISKPFDLSEFLQSIHDGINPLHESLYH